jgi:hypothetical protein
MFAFVLHSLIVNKIKTLPRENEQPTVKGPSSMINVHVCSADFHLLQEFEIWSIIRLNYTSGFIMISKEHLTARYESI